MAERMLDTEQVLDRIRFGRTWLLERIKDGEFPKPKHSWRRNLWRESDVDEWIVKFFEKETPKGQPNPGAKPSSH